MIDDDLKAQIARLKKRLAESEGKLMQIQQKDNQRAGALERIRSVFDEALVLTGRYKDVEQWVKDPGSWAKRLQQVGEDTVAKVDVF